MAEDVAGQGHIPCNERINVEEASEAEVMMLRDDFLRFANDNFGTATVTILTKDYAMPTNSKKSVHHCPALTSIYSLFKQRSFRGRVLIRESARKF